MQKIADSGYDLIGGTPILRARRTMEAHGLSAQLLFKLEFFNPAGSVKDRIALNMLRRAEAEGALRPGAVIIEPTSGNTGIGLASIAAAKGYRVILTMPETMSAERRLLLKAYGAELVLTEGAKGMQGAIQRARELAAETPGSFIPAQFDNPANPEAHEKTTGPEIWSQTSGEIDWFIACVGTGGTLTGVGRYLKGKNPAIQVAAVEPEDSAVLSGRPAGPHKIQGIGAGFVPNVLDTSLCDRVVTVGNDEAFTACRAFAKTEGLLVGVSSGAAIAAAIRLAKMRQNAGKTLLAVLPDTGERYLSGGLFGDAL